MAITFQTHGPDEALSQCIIKDGFYEAYETEWFTNIVRAGDTVVDIGANMGWYTLIASRIVGNTGKVIAFEPEQSNFELLTKNVSTNGMDNVTCYQKAVGENNRTVLFYKCPENSGHHCAWERDTSWDSKPIQQVSLDAILADEPHVNVIKIDVEGAEHLVLAGAKKTIERSSNLVLFLEVWFSGILRNGGNPCELLEYLDSAGFRLYQIIEWNKLLRPLDSMDSLRLEICHSNPNSNTLMNLLCIKNKSYEKTQISRDMGRQTVPTRTQLLEGNRT